MTKLVKPEPDIEGILVDSGPESGDEVSQAVAAPIRGDRGSSPLQPFKSGSWLDASCSLTLPDMTSGTFVFHQSGNVTEVDNGKEWSHKFWRGQRILIEPDPKEVLPYLLGKTPDQIEDKYWRVGDITDYCTYTVNGTDRVVLRVTLLYTLDDALQRSEIPAEIKEKLLKYSFSSTERIKTDHTEFIEPRLYGGHASKVLNLLDIKGLEISDMDRLLPEERRTKHSNKQVTYLYTGLGSSVRKRTRELNDAEEEEEEELSLPRVGTSSSLVDDPPIRSAIRPAFIRRRVDSAATKWGGEHWSKKSRF